MNFKDEIKSLIPDNSNIEEKILERLITAIADRVKSKIRNKAKTWESQNGFNCSFYIHICDLEFYPNYKYDSYCQTGKYEINKEKDKLNWKLELKEREVTFTLNRTYINKFISKLSSVLSKEEGFVFHRFNLVRYDEEKSFYSKVEVYKPHSRVTESLSYVFDPEEIDFVPDYIDACKPITCLMQRDGGTEWRKCLLNNTDSKVNYNFSHQTYYATYGIYTKHAVVLKISYRL